MNKANCFRSSSFHMAEGDILHILLKEEMGVTADIRLVSGGTTDNTQEVPDAPVALPASDITINSFTANWYFMENTSGFYLDVATDEDFTAFVAGYEDLDVGYVNEYPIVGLMDATSYYYRLRGYNDVGTGINSNIIETLTMFLDIKIETSLSGTFVLQLKGLGTVSIDWNDGSPIENVILNTTTYSSPTHDYVAGGTIFITNINGITWFHAEGDEITSIEGLVDCPNLVEIFLDNNLLTSFETSATWVHLWRFVLNMNQLTELIFHKEWTELYHLCIGNNQLTEITFWPEWVNLQILFVDDNLLTEITLFEEWTQFNTLYLQNNQLTEVILFEWYAMNMINLTDNLITDLIIFEYSNLNNLLLSNNAMAVDTVINDILITLDNLGIITGATIQLEGGTNAAPTGAGIVAKNSLIADGNTVTTN